MPDLFVSHATNDDLAATLLYDRLTAAGIDVWIDHKNIGLADDWDREIQNALNSCKNGLLVLSSRSANRPEILNEWRTILALGKRLYVVLIEAVPPDEFPFRLRTIQYVDLTRNFESNIQSLIDAVKNERDLKSTKPTTAQTNLISGNFPRWQWDLPLIGREQELQNLQAALASNSRITAILGVGGIGKTRLAAEIIKTSTFQDGVVWHTIEDHTTVDDLTLLIRDHLTLDPETDANEVWNTLNQRQVLLALDNGERCSNTARAAYAERINNIDLSSGSRILLMSWSVWTELQGVSPLNLPKPKSSAAVEILQAKTIPDPAEHAPGV